MTKSQEPILRACLPCRKATLKPDGWDIEGVHREFELPESPSVDAPQAVDVCVFIELFSTAPVNAGRLSLAVRGPAGEHLWGHAATVDQWDPKKKHLAISFAIGVRTSVCDTVRFEVLWNGRCLGGCAIELKPPGTCTKLVDLGIQPTLLDAAACAAEYQTEDGAVAA
jgi:hypothetical protein